MLEVICLTVAFMLGLLAWRCGLPALIGFLAAGFLINPFAERLSLPASTPEILDHVSHLGVLLLLFTVGLKLKLRSLGQPEVLGGGLIHFIATLAVFAPGLHWLGGIAWPTAVLLAVALAFSSTVLSAKSLLLMGLVLAVVVGGAGFTALGLSGEVGALLLGALVAGHPRAQELGKSLWALKELFLVGFFLKIGMSGLPDWQALGFALAFTALLPLKAALFFFLLILFRLRARNAFQAAISLTSYSEFGLIVAAALVPDALVSLALAVALSFLVAAPLQRNAHALFARFEPVLRRFEKDHWHPDEQPASLGEARVMIVGMGRTGTAAYDRLHADHTHLIGLDADPSRVESHGRDGRHVVYADVEDVGFWNSVDLRHVEVVVLSLPDAETKIFATRQLRAHGFTGAIVAHSLYEDEAEAIRQAGADETYLTMHEAGLGLAEHVRQGLHVAATE